MEDYPKQIIDDWYVLYDEKTKKEYYANMKLNITSWNLPENVKSLMKSQSSIDEVKDSKIDFTSIIKNSSDNTTQSSSILEYTAVGNTITSSPHKAQDVEEVTFISKKPVTYLHMNDPFSLKLLIWLKETNYIEYVDLRIVNDATQAAMKNDFQQLQIDIYKSLNQKNYALQELSFPTTMYSSGDIISGADHNIHTLLSHYPSPPNSSTESPIGTIDWNELILFNFYSCGLLLEHSNHLQDDSNNPSRTSTIGSVYSQEYLSLHEENIRLQLYLSGNQIQQFRSEQSYRVENQRLRDEIEKLSSRLVELTHKLSIERTAIYNKMNENKNLMESIKKLEEEKHGLVNIMTTQTKVHTELLNQVTLENNIRKDLLENLKSVVLGENTKRNNEDELSPTVEYKELYLKKYKNKLEEYRSIIQNREDELRTVKENMRNLETHLGKTQSELQLFQQIIRE